MLKIIKNSKIWFTISGIICVASLAAIVFLGFRISIDFTGGTVIEFQSENNDRLEITKNILNNNGITSYQLRQSGNNGTAIKLPLLKQDQYEKITLSLKTKMPDYTEIRYDNIGPVIGRSLTNNSIIAVILSIIGIIIYIAFAFRKIPKPLSSWKFSITAVIALIHDLIVTAGFVAVFGYFFDWMEIDVLFITAMLTILGYSINDTIVVFDRLRENFIKNPHQKIEVVAQESINETITRSLNTSITTILALVAILVFGGPVIRHFIITLTFGFVAGSYSSIFVATSLLVYWQKKTTAKRGERA